MQTFKYLLFNGWTVMRWVRLLLGLAFAYQAIIQHDSISALLSVFLLVQAITNTGCCGVQGCSVPQKQGSTHSVEDSRFEEVK
jgi:hypothetical protein